MWRCLDQQGDQEYEEKNNEKTSKEPNIFWKIFQDKVTHLYRLKIQNLFNETRPSTLKPHRLPRIFHSHQAYVIVKAMVQGKIPDAIHQFIK